jgi:hypothetical protein
MLRRLLLATQSLKTNQGGDAVGPVDGTVSHIMMNGHITSFVDCLLATTVFSTSKATFLSESVGRHVLQEGRSYRVAMGATRWLTMPDENAARKILVV